MADATDLKSVVRKGVRVRLPPSAPHHFNNLQPIRLFTMDQRNGANSVEREILVMFVEELRALVLAKQRHLLSVRAVIHRVSWSDAF